MVSNVVQLDPTIYRRSAVEQAIVAYAKIVRITFSEQVENAVIIEREGSEGGQIVDEFVNYALMASLEQLLPAF